MGRPDFDTLTYRGQVGRMRALGRLALERFGFSPTLPLDLCNHGENTVFRVTDDRGHRYALRIHRLDYQTPDNIRSEMMWLDALARDTDVTAQRPVEGIDGETVQRVRHEGVPGTRSCVLMRWVDGGFAGMKRGRTYHERLGALMAKLHAHAAAWKRPAAFDRRAWDEDALLGDEPMWGSPFEAPGLSARDKSLFLESRVRIFETMARLGKSPERWGLIHADLHVGNVLVHDGTVRPIDFDDCGFGWLMYDVLVAVGAPLWNTEQYDRKMGWFLDAYARVRPVDALDLDAMEAFYVTRNISIVGWLTQRSDNPHLAKHLSSAIERTRGACERYLAT